MEEGRTLAPAEDFSVPLAGRTLKADRFGTKLVQSLSTAAPWGSQGGGGAAADELAKGVHWEPPHSPGSVPPEYRISVP